MVGLMWWSITLVSNPSFFPSVKQIPTTRNGPKNLPLIDLPLLADANPIERLRALWCFRRCQVSFTSLHTIPGYLVQHCGSLDNARRQMETNFWGPCRIMLSVLPGMRARKSGVIVNLSSTAGLRAAPTYSHYSASKFALEAVSEGLSQEVVDFNIRVQLVEPGAFRTSFLTQESIQYAPLGEAYRGTSAEHTLDMLRNMDGKQAGDPVKAAERVFEVVTCQGMAEGRKSNLRLPLGSDCLKVVRAKLCSVLENFEQFEDIAASTDGVP